MKAMLHSVLTFLNFKVKWQNSCLTARVQVKSENINIWVMVAGLLLDVV